MGPSLRPWAAIAISAAAVAALTGAMHLAAGPQPAPSGGNTVSYEVTGAAGAVARMQYGDVQGQIFNPWAATMVDGTLPWHVTVPLGAPLAMQDLQVQSPGTTITCTVRHNGKVVSSQTGPGLVLCDTPPG